MISELERKHWFILACGGFIVLVFFYFIIIGIFILKVAMILIYKIPSIYMPSLLSLCFVIEPHSLFAKKEFQIWPLWSIFLIEIHTISDFFF